jgi:8-oxo-dGTP pyrophosphatase MutT (NUDIX family)
VPDTVTVPAATVVLIRDAPKGLEVLMLRRSSRGFFGGMWVFPGGQVDAGDVDPAAPDDEIAAARRAAVREAEEEAGVVVDLDGLVTLSHWMPPAGAPRRFSTWFFVAPASEIEEVTVDGAEIHEHAWLRPEDAMARRDAGEIELAPPTWMTLRWLSDHADVVSAMAHARVTEADPPRYATRISSADDVMTLLWAGDAGYESTDASVPGTRNRLWMRDEGWRYESTTAVTGDVS